MRACALLPAVTGNLCKPGAGFLYLNGNLQQRRMDEEYLSGAHLGADRTARRASATWISRAVLEDPERSRALFVWNMNPLASCPQQARLRRALQREDLLTIVLDLFATDTTSLADYVLPAASFLEFDDLIASYFHLTLSAQVKAMEPLGSALPNLEIFRRLARAMDFTEPEFQESDAAILANLMKRSGLGLSFASLAERGSIWVPEEPAVQFADGVFATPSGRIEVASARAAADGHPRLPQPWSDTRPAEGRLRLLSPAHAWLLNTTFGNVRQIDHRIGEATIALHPADAAERRLARGGHRARAQQLRPPSIEGRSFRMKFRAAWRSRTKADGWARMPASANVNVLNPGRKSDMGESTAVHSVEVSVSAI